MNFRKYFHLKSKKQSRRAFLISSLLIMIAIAAAILIVNQDNIHRKIYQTAGLSIQEWIFNETNGLYILEYDSIQVNIVEKQLNLTKIKFGIDSAVFASLEEKPRNIYHITSPNLFLDIASLWDVLWNSTLEFTGINISNPKVTIVNLSPRDSVTSVSLLSGDLYLKISKYLDEFNINSFLLTDGSVNYKEIRTADIKEFQIDNIDAYVDNLVIDAENKTTGTDRIRVVLKKPSFTLADNIHKLEMDSILLDSENGNVVLNEVVVYPIYEKLKNVDLSKTNIYNFNIPNIFLEGIDFPAAYNENILNISRIFIPRPEIIVDTHKQEIIKSKAAKNNLQKQLSLIFNRITTKEFLLLDGKIDLALEANNRQRNIKIKNTTIKIGDLEIDTAKYSEQNSYVNFNKFNLELEDYHLILPDSIHQLTAREIAFSSDSSKLSIDEIEITPTDNDYNNKNRIYARIPSIQLEGLDLNQYLEDHHLRLGTININDPEIKYYNLKSPDTTGVILFNIKLADNKIFESVNSKQINFKNLDLVFVDEEKKIATIIDGNFSLHHLKLDQHVEANRLFNSKSIIINLPHVQLLTSRGDYILINNISARMPESTLLISSLNYVPENRIFEVVGKDLKAHGFDIKTTILENNITIDSLMIGQAEIIKSGIKVDTGLQKRKDVPIHIGYLNIKEGLVSIENHKSTTKITDVKGFANNLHISSENIDIEHLNFTTGKITVTSSTDNFYAGASKAEITNKNLILFLPFVKPYHPGSENFVNFSSSQASLRDYNLSEILNNNRIIAQEFKLLSANFELNKEHKNVNLQKKQEIIINWEKILNNKLEGIAINRILLSGPKLEFDINGGAFSTHDFEMELEKFNTSLEGSEYFLNSKNLRVKTNTLSYVKDDLAINIDNVALDENKRLITINNLKIENSNALISIPLAFGKKMDLRLLAEEKKWKGAELEIAGFYLKYKQQERNKKENPTNMELPLIIFNVVKAHQGVVNYTTQDGEEYKINNISWELTNFDTEAKNKNILYSDKLIAKAGAVTGLVRNKMDRLFISGITMSNDKIHLDHLYLKPEYEKMKYAYQVGHETDWINLTVNDINISKFDLSNLEEELDIKYINVKTLKANIYRDKKLPEPKAKDKLLPQEMLRSLSKNIFIDTIRIESANVTYQEMSELAFEPGELYFENVKVYITNITNVPSHIKKNKYLKFTADGKVEGTPLHLVANFDLTSPVNEFMFSGNMGEGGLTKFNKIMEKNVFLKIEKGHSRGLSFNLKANDKYALGSMKFYYKGLKVSMIDKQTNKTSGIDESLASFLANTFVINSNNPSLFILKEGDIYFERDKNRSIFNYWAKSFLSGVLSSIGVKNNKKEMKELATESKPN